MDSSALRRMVSSLYDEMADLPSPGLLFDRVQQCATFAEREHCLGAVALAALRPDPAFTGTLPSISGTHALAWGVRTGIRATDSVACLDEGMFAVLLPITEGREGTLTALRRVGESLARSAADYHRVIHLGVAIFPTNGRTYLDLYDQARAALERVPDEGGVAFVDGDPVALV